MFFWVSLNSKEITMNLHFPCSICKLRHWCESLPFKFWNKLYVGILCFFLIIIKIMHNAELNLIYTKAG